MSPLLPLTAFVIAGVLGTPAASLPVALQTSTRPAQATGSISGTIIDAATRRPLADVLVQLGTIRQYTNPTFADRQLTDPDGRFLFADLPESNYFLRVTKSGYFNAVFGDAESEMDPGRSIHLNAGEWFSTATVTMSRPSSISGTVTDERGEPVVGIYVRALQSHRVGGSDHLATTQPVLTDDRGVYRICQLKPGRYIISVPSVQASAPAAAPLTALLGRTQQSIDAARLRPGGLPPVDPMVDADTDTRVVVGHYPVPPPPVNGQALTYPMAFAGGSSIAEASVIALGAGSEVLGADVRLAPVPAVRVSGVVEAPPEARSNLMLRLLPVGLEELGTGGEAGTALSSPDGSFVFANVPAGNYVIEVPLNRNQYETGPADHFYGLQLPLPLGTTTRSNNGFDVASSPGLRFSRTSLGPARYFGRTPVSVGAGGLTGVSMRLGPSVTISGRLVGEPDPGQRASPPQYLSLETATGDPATGVVSTGIGAAAAPPGEFKIGSVAPGLYLFRGLAPWSIKSVTVNGKDYTRTPLDISSGADISDVVVVFTNTIQILSGTVRSSNGTVDDEAAVIIFPAESAEWVNYGLNPTRIKTALTSTSGAYAVRGLPAGDYYVVAVPASQRRAWVESDFFARAQRGAARVTIGWGDTKTVDLRVLEVR